MKITRTAGQISAHISLAESTKSTQASRLGIPNIPTPEAITNMRLVAENCFEPLREHHGKPIGITSFFRSKALNIAVGGAINSQHNAGVSSELPEAAIDLDMDIFNNGMSNAEAFEWLRKNVEFDQLIWEFGNDKNPDWVHVSYREGQNRKRCLRSRKEGHKTVYNQMTFKD